MAYDTEKLVKLEALKQLAERTKSEADALNTAVDNLTAVGGQPNTIETVKVNGAALAIADKIVDILITTGSADGTIKVNNVDVSVAGLAAMAYKADVSESELAAALKTKLNDKADSATTLAGYGITDAYTKDETNAKISAVYHPAGSAAFADLPTPSAATEGYVYNVTDAFTTTANFREGAGHSYPAGTNVGIVKDGATYKYDAYSGWIDLTPYAKTNDVNSSLDGKVDKEIGKGLSTNDYTTAEKNKLAGIAENANKYIHPSHTAHASGLYKTTIDNQGHVSGATAVVKSDITALGIPAQDTTYSPATQSANGLMSSADKTKLDGFTVATETEVTEMLNEVFPASA